MVRSFRVDLGNTIAARTFRHGEPHATERTDRDVPVSTILVGVLVSTLAAGAFFLDLGGVFRVFPLATEGRLHFHAGPVAPWGVIGSLPRMAMGRRLRARGLVERAGTEMIVEAVGAPLTPIVDGEAYENVRRLEVRPGPTLSIALA